MNSAASETEIVIKKMPFVKADSGKEEYAAWTVGKSEQSRATKKLL